jgi:hypothetical protein
VVGASGLLLGTAVVLFCIPYAENYYWKRYHVFAAKLASNIGTKTNGTSVGGRVGRKTGPLTINNGTTIVDPPATNSQVTTKPAIDGAILKTRATGTIKVRARTQKSKFTRKNLSEPFETSQNKCGRESQASRQ